MHNPITQQQAEQLLENTTEGPWITYAGSFGRIESVGPIEQGFSGSGLECTEEDADLAASGPDLARTVIWLWEQNQQQQAKIKRLQAGVLETSRGEWAYTTPDDMEDELESLIEGDMK